MECRFDKSMLQALIDDSVEPIEIIFILEHLKTCKNCMNELKALYIIDEKLKYFYHKGIKCEDKLSSITELTVDNIFAQEEVKRLKDIIHDSAKFSSLIYSNSSRFLEFAPGVPYLRSQVSKTYKNIKKNFRITHRRNAK